VNKVKNSNLVSLNTSINLNVLNNDKLLVKKVIDILEGRQHYNENFKLDVDEAFSTFKIILNVKSGVSIVIFTCKMDIICLTNSSQVLFTMIGFFRTKLLNIKKTDEAIEELNRTIIEGIKRYNNLSAKKFNTETELLEKMCLVLNYKKTEIRRLAKIKGIYFEEPEEIVLQADNVNVLNVSQSEELNNSQALSLTDLI
jgi:hypothetical protein